MLSYYIIANGKQKVEYTNGKNNGRESQSKTSEIGEKESMEQGGSSATAVFCDAFFSCLIASFAFLLYHRRC